MASASLDFVRKNAGKETNYREEQKELIEKALEVANGDKLGALQYIVSCLAHEGLNVEFEIEYRVIDNYIILPVIEIEPEDSLGFYVSWGDGTITHNKIQHTYESEKKSVNYTIRFFGLGIKQFGHSVTSIGNNIIKIISFGDLGHTFTSLVYACANCVNLESVPANIPRTITDLSFMFKDCMNFNQPLNTWDVSNITNMSNLFIGCNKFNQPLDKWDVSKVTTMSHMFTRCFKFNQPLNSWITSNITDMYCMFSHCRAFDQPLDNWDISKVTDMRYMFAYSGQKPPPNWKISSGTKTEHMFMGYKIIGE
jgi:surface protein